VNVVRETNATTTASTTYVNVAGASTAITVPAGESALILARFSAESACYGGGTAGHWCSLRIRIDGVDMDPSSGMDFAFDSTNGGDEGPSAWESHSMDRSRVVGPGTHVVVVQAATTNATVTLRLDDWSLTVERSQM
jgi:hypothetical protein